MTKQRTELERLCALARARGPLTDAQRREQIISLAYGNLAVERPGLERADIERAALRVLGP